MSQEEQLKKSLIHWFGGFKHDDTLSHPARVVDLCRDIMWKEFWDRLFYKYFKDPMPGQVTSIHARHEENKQIAENINKSVYATALKFVSGRSDSPLHEEYSKIFHACLYTLNGVDVYWDGPVEAKPERAGTTDYEDEFGIRGKIYRVQRRTKTLEWPHRPNGKKLLNEKFGSLEIIPFPFSAIFKYDDNDHGIMFSWYEVSQGIERDPDEGFRQFKQLVEQNMDPTITHLRELRLKLRTLNGRTVSAQHNSGVSLRGTFQLQTRATAKNGMSVEESDPELDAYMGRPTKKGKKAKKLKKLTPEQEQKLAAKRERAILSMADMSRGFDSSLHDLELRDANGNKCSRVCGADQQQKMLNKLTASGSNALLGQDLNLEHIAQANCDEQEWRALEAVYQSKRVEFINYQTRKQAVLSYAFWLDIYQTVYASKETLRHALIECEAEKHPLLRVLYDGGTLEKELDQLFANMSNFNHHTMIRCYWYKVWIPVMRIMENFNPKDAPLTPLIDTRNPHAICYNPLDRDALEIMIRDHSSPLSPLGNSDKLESTLETIYRIMHKLEPDNPTWLAGVRNGGALALSIPDEMIPSGAQTPISRDPLQGSGGLALMSGMDVPVTKREGEEEKSDDDESEEEEEESEEEEEEEESDKEDSDVESEDEDKKAMAAKMAAAKAAAADDSDSDIDMPKPTQPLKKTSEGEPAETSKGAETPGKAPASTIPATTNGQPPRKEIINRPPLKPNNDRASCAVKMRTCMGGGAHGQQPDPCSIM